MYKKGTNNEWNYNLTDHLMVDLETTTTLGSIACIVTSCPYELHPRDEKMFHIFINKCCPKHIKSIKRFYVFTQTPQIHCVYINSSIA